MNARHASCCRAGMASGFLKQRDDLPIAGTALEPNKMAAVPEPVVIATPLKLRSVALTVVAAAAVIALLSYMQAVIVPFVLAAVIFYALDPAVDRLQRWRVPRAIGAFLM